MKNKTKRGRKLGDKFNWGEAENLNSRIKKVKNQVTV